FLEDRSEEVQDLAWATLRTPPKTERLLDRLNREDLVLHTDIEDTDNLLDTLANRLIFGLLLAVGVLSPALLYAFADPVATGVAGVFTLVIAGLLVRSFRNRGRSRSGEATSEFTRQGLTQRPPGSVGTAETSGIEAMARTGSGDETGETNAGTEIEVDDAEASDAKSNR